MKLEENMSPIKLKCIEKGLAISGFGVVENSVRSESGRIIVLRDQAYDVPGLPKDLRIIFSQGISKSEGYKDNFIAHFHDDHDSYAELNLKKDKLVWQKDKPADRVYIKYNPKNNLPTHASILHNHREREFKASKSAVCVTDEANQNLTLS